MKISFIIPAYNEEHRISTCLTSVQEEIARYAYDTEVIVVNNASKDKTKEVVSSFSGVTIVDETQKGIVFARQAGFKVSSGDLIANVDADTKIPKGWLKTVFSEFEKDEKLVALSGPFIYYDSSLLTRLTTKVFYFFGYVFNVCNHVFLGTASMLQGGNFILRRTALEKINGYDTSIEFYGEDIDVGRRISQVGKVKWTFRLPMYASGRRLNHEGVIVTGIRYALNFVWVTFFGKPFTHEHTDIRPRSGQE